MFEKGIGLLLVVLMSNPCFAQDRSDSLFQSVVAREIDDWDAIRILWETHRAQYLAELSKTHKMTLSFKEEKKPATGTLDVLDRIIEEEIRESKPDAVATQKTKVVLRDSKIDLTVDKDMLLRLEAQREQKALEALREKAALEVDEDGQFVDPELYEEMEAHPD